MYRSMHHKQAGFGIVGLILIVLAIAAVGFVGWKLYDSNKSTDSDVQKSSSPKLYTDTAKRFTFEYPDNWEASFPEPAGTDGPGQPQLDWAQVSRPVVIKPSTGAKDNNVIVTPGCETTASDGSAVSVLQNLKDRKDKFHTQEAQTINGYEAFYDRLHFEGDAESYLDHTYFVTSGTDCVLFSYRENWHHDMSNTNFDDSKNVPAFKSVVQSLQFSD